MKILFVEKSSDLQENWIEPLRGKGWGVVRARSVEDATRMVDLHGEALEIIAVGEAYVKWAEKQDLPFVVLISTWSDTDVMKHQNSEISAVGYLNLKTGVNDLYRLFESGGADEGEVDEEVSEEIALGNGTDGIPLTQKAPHLKSVPPPHDLSLEDYSQVLTKPESTSTQSLQLDAPTVLLGGADAKPEVEEIRLNAAAQQAAQVATEEKVEKTRVDIGDGKTRVDLGDSNKTRVDMGDNHTLALDTGIFQVGQETKISVMPMKDFESEIDKVEREIGEDAATRIFTAFNPAQMQELQELRVPPEQDYSIQQSYQSPQSYSVPQSYSAPLNQFSVNPSPTANISDLETLRSYVALREQDVAVLSGQLRSSQERLQQLELMVKLEKAKNTELSHMASKQEQKIKGYDQEKQVELEVLHLQIEDMDQQLKDRTEKARSIETKLRLTVEEVNKVKERVRVDIRRIRVREKELEGQLEVLKKDSSALLQARDEKILELKRKIDLLEFNMELIQEQFSKEKQSSSDLKTRLKDAAHVMKQAGGLLGA